MPLAIRDAQAADVATIADAVARQPLLARYGTSAEALGRALGAALDRGDGLIAAESEGALCGAAWFLTRGTFALGGYLRLIAVFPGSERHGAGTALLDDVERRVAADSRFLFLLCDSANEAARRFYAKRGYRESGQLAELVKPGIDEVILWKRLWK